MAQPEQAEIFLNQLFDRVVVDLEVQGATIIHTFSPQEVFPWPHHGGGPTAVYLERAVFMEDPSKIYGILIGPELHNGWREPGLQFRYGFYRRGLKIEQMQAEGRQFIVQPFCYHPNPFLLGPRGEPTLRDLQVDSADDLALVVSQLFQLSGIVYYDPRFEIIGNTGLLTDGMVVPRLPIAELSDPAKIDNYTRAILKALDPEISYLPLQKPA